MTLKVDEIQNTTGGAVTLTKQQALKVAAAYNQHASTTYNGITAGSGGVESFNVSSYDDDSTGNAGVNLTSNMATIQFNFIGSVLSNNNTCTAGTDISTGAVEVAVHDADSSSAQDNLWYCGATGDLA